MAQENANRFVPLASQDHLGRRAPVRLHFDVKSRKSLLTAAALHTTQQAARRQLQTALKQHKGPRGECINVGGKSE